MMHQFNRRRLLLGAGCAGASAILAPALWATPRRSGGIREVTAITDVFGDGQKLVGLALLYDRTQRTSALRPADYRVEGRTILRAFASTSAEPGHAARAGRWVILMLSPDDATASLKQSRRPAPMARPQNNAAADPAPKPPGELGQPLPGGPMQTYRTPAAKVSQTGSTQIHSVDSSLDLSLRRFVQRTFRDPATGRELRYNLYVPQDIGKDRPCPLVLFMHDASVTGSDPLLTLKQGLGAVIWARPEEQARRRCIVVAPQFDEVIADDQSRTSPARETVHALLQSLMQEYPVDPARLYCTGQSGGAMMTIALNIRYPDLFAASFIVAGQWDATLVQPLARARLWIMVSEGDLKAFPGQNAIVATLRENGARIARATWDGRWTAQRFDEAAAAMEGEGAPINYVVLAKGTVVPVGEPDNGGSNHVNTWRIAYTIEAVRDWLFRQRR